MVLWECERYGEATLTRGQGVFVAPIAVFDTGGTFPVDRLHIVPSALSSVPCITGTCFPDVVSTRRTAPPAWWGSRDDFPFGWVTRSAAGLRCRKHPYVEVPHMFLKADYSFDHDFTELLGIVLKLLEALVRRATVVVVHVATVLSQRGHQTFMISNPLRRLLGWCAFFIYGTSHALVHVGLDDVGRRGYLWPWLYLINPVAHRLFSEEVSSFLNLDQCYFSAELDVWQVLVVMFRPSSIVHLRVVPGVWSCASAIRLQDCHQYVTCVQVVAYCLLHLGIAKVTTSNQI